MSEPSNLPLWAREMAPHGGPRPRLATLLFVMVVTVALVLLLPAMAAQTGASSTPPTTPPPCATVWPPTCEEGRRATADTP